MSAADGAPDPEWIRRYGAEQLAQLAGSARPAGVLPTRDELGERYTRPALVDDAAVPIDDDAVPLDDVRAGLVIRPGDRVLLTLDPRVLQADALALVERLHERHPDVTFTVIGAVRDIAVVRDGERS